MVDLARIGAAVMRAPGRREACLDQARIFRDMAEVDPVNRGYWLDETMKWLERAATPVGHVVVTLEAPSVSPEVTISEPSVISAAARPR